MVAGAYKQLEMKATAQVLWQTVLESVSSTSLPFPLPSTHPPETVSGYRAASLSQTRRWLPDCHEDTSETILRREDERRGRDQADHAGRYRAARYDSYERERLPEISAAPHQLCSKPRRMCRYAVLDAG
ncbi:hypothetical protein EYF80_036023 [Liparis tanakae]|uniref:Uncharacterized protein n=1 Tax=Liparis tanakae TaxID=230148 RepID=A0A4Z2GJX1_9TELE|nr:hypothetical protein EYF80_036023 [Liparis tanakae]